MTATSNSIRPKLFIFLSILFSFSSIFSSENLTNLNKFNSLSSEEEAILKQIISYLSHHSLSPFLPGGNSEYVHLDFIKDSYNNNTHALGMITQGNNSYIALFSINKTWFWNKIKADLVYITTDDPISPILFADVAYLATSFLTRDLSNFHVFIERKEDPNLPNESKLQKWVFFNQQETAELFVILTEDGRGGTYFHVYRS